MEVKWRKLPKPEQLAKLPAAVSSSGVYFLQKAAPRLTREIVQRMKAGFVVGPDGNIAPAPPYSASYRRWLKTVGRDGERPDFVFTGGMLQKISNRISTHKKGGLKLVITTYGRINEKLPKAPRETETYTRRAYTWFDPRRQISITVPETTITNSRANSRADQYADRKLSLARRRLEGDSQLVYNAHLAWWLGKRAGYGRWKAESTARLFGISNEQRGNLANDWMEFLERRGILSVWTTDEIRIR